MPIAGLGALISGPLPTASYMVLDGAEDGAKAIVNLVKNSPKMLKALRRFSEVGETVKLSQWVAGILVAVAVDVRALKPDSAPAVLTGVAKAYVATHPDVEFDTEESGGGPRFPAAV